MPRRALTLFEMLVALALVLALGAMVAPALMGALDERRFDAACDQVREVLMLARAQAQATGEAVEVRFIPGAGIPGAGAERVVARPFDPRDLELENDAFAAARVEADALKALAMPWANRELPDGCRIVDEDPSPTPPPPEGGEFRWWGAAPEPRDGRRGDPGGTGETRELRIAVFIPDGSALFIAPLWIVDEDDRAASVRINAWTGLATIERGDARTASDGASSSDESASEVDADAHESTRADPAPAPSSSTGDAISDEAPGEGEEQGEEDEEEGQ